MAKALFPDGDPVGQVIRVRNMPFRVLGVLAEKGQGQWGQDQDDFVVAPWTTVQKKLLGINYIQQVSITAKTSELVEPTAVAITRLMRARHRSPGPEQDDFSVRTVEEMAATRVQMASTMTGLLMSVASVSLLVGGIGIMNIMLVSVTERTREIGVRMAVGAKTGDVLKQFLAEAVALSLVGGPRRHPARVGVSEAIADEPRLAGPHHDLVDPRRLRLLRGRGGLLRLVPGPQGGEPRPHRGVALRVAGRMRP